MTSLPNDRTVAPDAPSAPRGTGETAPERDSQGRLKIRLFYRAWRWLCRTILYTVYRCEVFDAHLVPTSGPMLMAANHQSYLDPPLVGGMVEREMHFVARSGLFWFKPFAWVITKLNSIPLSDSASDLAAIKEIIRRLEMRQGVVIFPEGSRSHDGAIEPFKRGVALLVKRARCPVVPVAVEGCFDAWPRGKAPGLFGKRVAVKYGAPIPYDELMKDGADAALARLARQIDGMRMELRAHMRAKTKGRYPKAGPGDEAFKPRVSAEA